MSIFIWVLLGVFWVPNYADFVTLKHPNKSNLTVTLRPGFELGFRTLFSGFGFSRAPG